MSSKKAKGKRAKTRDLFKTRGSKMTVNSLLKEYKEGEQVRIKINPSIHKGMPFRRFQNTSGKVIKRQGKAFVVSVMKGNRSQDIVTTAAHLAAA